MTSMGPGAAFYVGDHPTDAMCVAQARQEMVARGLEIRVWSIAVLYGGESTDGWPEAPDFLARTPEEIVGIVGRESRCQQPVLRVESPAEDLEEMS